MSMRRGIPGVFAVLMALFAGRERKRWSGVGMASGRLSGGSFNFDVQKAHRRRLKWIRRGGRA
jgi:deoxyribodipyrimidine photolyase-like uncharacterized protein